MRRERASVVCVDGGALLCVRLRDPLTRVARLFPPGGAIDPGETPAQAAAREALEETGYLLEVDASSELVSHYPFVWSGIPFECVTHFFAARLRTPRAQPRPVNDASYHEGVVWLELAHVDRELAYEPAIRDAVLALVPRSAS